MKSEAYVIKNKKGQYLSSEYVYHWIDFDEPDSTWFTVDKLYAEETLERVQNYLKDGKLVKVVITEED